MDISVKALQNFILHDASERTKLYAAQAVGTILPKPTHGRFKPRPYQRVIATDISKLFSRKQCVGIEVYCGGGKTTIGAMAMLDILKAHPHGHIVFVSPNRASFPHFQKEVERVFKDKARVDIEKYFRVDCNIHVKTHYEFVTAQEAKGRTPASVVLKDTVLFVVDEAHRYPEDVENTTEIIGRVYDSITDRINRQKCSVLAMTATFDRTDGKLPFGIEQPDIRYTMNDLIQAGYAPDLRGYFVPVALHKSVNTKISGDDIVLDDSDKVIKKIRKHINAYYRQISDVIVGLCEVDPEFGHCVFVSRQKDANRLTVELNQRLGYEADGSNGGFVCLVSGNGTMRDRQEMIATMKQSKKHIGYVTCNIGAESIDIPSLKYCHIVAQTKSKVRLMQMVGRIARKFEGKRDCVVVDYKIMKAKIIQYALGIADIARKNELDPAKIKNGGFIARTKTPNLPSNCSLTLGEIQDWVVRETYEPNSADLNKEKLLEMARRGEERPSATSKDPEIRKLGIALGNYTRSYSGTYDPEFTTQISNLVPHWFDMTASTKAILLEMAQRGDKRPSQHNKDPKICKLGRALSNYTSPPGGCYDLEFTAKIRELASHWFTDTAKEKKAVLLDMAAGGDKKPSQHDKDPNIRILGCALSQYIRKTSKSYDPDFTTKIRKIATRWFIHTSVENKAKLLEMAQQGEKKPSGSAKDPKIRKMGMSLSCYIRPTSGCYDPDFAAKIRKLAPHWFVDTASENKAILLDMARRGEKRPSASDKDPIIRKLGQAVQTYTGRDGKYDPDFIARIRKLAPHWFKQKTSIIKQEDKEAA